MFKLKGKEERKRKQEELSINNGGNATPTTSSMVINTNGLSNVPTTPLTPVKINNISQLTSNPTLTPTPLDSPISPPIKKLKGFSLDGNDSLSNSQQLDLKVLQEQKKHLTIKNKELTKLNNQLNKSILEISSKNEKLTSTINTIIRLWNHVIEDLTIQLERLPVNLSTHFATGFEKVYNKRTDEESINRIIEQVKYVFSKIMSTINDIKENKLQNNSDGKLLDERLKQLNVEYRAMKDEYNELQENINQSDDEISRLKNLLEEKEYDLKEALKKIEKLSMEKEEIKSATLTSPISPFPNGSTPFASSSSQGNEDLVEMIKRRDDDLQEYIDKYTREYKSNEENKLKILQLEVKLKQTMMESEQYRNDYLKQVSRVEYVQEQYKDEIERFNVSRKDLSLLYEDAKTKFQTELNERKEEIRKLKQTIENLVKETDSCELTREKIRLNIKCKDLAERISKMKYKYTKEVKQLNEDLKLYKQDKEEIIRQVEMYRKRNEELTKKFAQMEQQAQGSTDVNVSDEVVKWKEQAEMFEQSLNETIQLFEKLQQEKDDLSKKLDRSEEQRINATKEKIKTEKLGESLKEDIKKLQSKIVSFDKLKSEFEKKSNNTTIEKNYLLDIIEKNKLEELQYKKLTDTQRQIIEQLKISYNNIHVEVEQYNQKNLQLLQDLEKKENEYNKTALKLKRLEEEKIQLEKTKSNIDETSLEHYKRKVTCSQCHEREVNTIVARCFHTFCKECITANLKTRNRKCPACGVRYDPNDVKQFYLN
ncbi:hypothetical protein ABK040_015560 [Willaertia magna]